MSVSKLLQNFSEITQNNSTPVDEVYQFGSFTLSESQRLLVCEDSPVALAAKDFDVLLVLLKHWPNLVTKTQFLDLVWQNSFVEEANIGVHIARLRKALRRYSADHKYIQTVHKCGYRFTAEVVLGNHEVSGWMEKALNTHDQSQPAGYRTKSADPLETILTLTGGLRIEVRKRPYGTEITLEVPKHAACPIRHLGFSLRRSEDDIVDMSVAHDGINRITLTLEYDVL